MFENALWKSRTHAKQPLWFLMGPMIVFFVAIPFCIHFFGVGIVFGIDVCLALIFLFAVIIFGRKFKWNNTGLIFAVMSNGIYFSSKNANGSYFHEDFTNIKGYSFAPDGEYVTVTVFFHRRSNAGMMGNINAVKMIKIENFEKLQEVFASFEIPVING